MLVPKKKLMKGIVFVSVFFIALPNFHSQVPSYIPTNGLLAWYPFTGNANDAWVNAHNGTVYGATLTTDRFNQPNCAYSYDGINDYISVPDNATNFRPQSLTISAWCLFNSSPIDKYFVIAKNVSGYTISESVSIAYQGSYPSCWFALIGTPVTYGPALNYPSNITTGTWYNIIYEFDDINNIQKMFINGVLTLSSTINTNPIYDTYPWTIGAQYELGILSYFWNGKIDDIGIWDRVLSPCEINQIYNLVPCGSSSMSICAGSTLAISPVNYANLTNVTYSLNPLGLINNTGTFIITPTSSQIYTTYVTGLDANNSVQTMSTLVNVSVNPQPLVSPTYTASTCSNPTSAFDLNLNFNPANPVPNYTVSWSSIPNGITNNQETNASGVAAGIYMPTVTAQGGCQVTTTININPPPTLSSFTFIPLGTNIHSITCAQPTLNISTTNTSLNYTWTNVNTGTLSGITHLFNANHLGTWTVSAKDAASECTTTHTFIITQNITPPVITSITPSLQMVTCANPSIQTVIIVASPSVNITHSIVASSGAITIINSPTALFLPAPDNYHDYIINSATGCSTHATFSVLSSAGFPTLQVTSTGTLAGQGNFTVGCNNHSLTVINIINPNTTPITGGGLEFSFLPPGSTNTVPVFGSEQSTVVSTPGTWTIVVLSTNNNCETRIPVTIVQNTVSPNRFVSVPTHILSCALPSVVLTGYSDNNVIYSWNFPPSFGNLISQTFTVNTNTQQINNSSLGNFTLTVTDINNGCENFTIVPMQQNLFAPIPKISVTNNTLTCITTTMQLSNSSKTGIPSITGFPNGGIIQAILWEAPAPQSTLSLMSSYIASTPGTYTLTVIDTNNGCLSNTVITIHDGRIYPVVNNPAPPPFVIDCAAETALLDVNMSNTFVTYTYSWTGPPSNTFAPSSIIKTPSVTALGIYTVEVTNINNGCTSTGTTSVIKGRLYGDFVPDKMSGFAPLIVTFNNTSTSSLNNNNITSVWSYGNGLSDEFVNTASSEASGYTIYKQPGTYQVILYTAKGVCKDTDTMFVIVDVPPKLEVPNVFTPNNDGVNDIFFVHTANLVEIHVLIYDRWENLTYEVTSYTGNIEWTGKTLYGKEAADGTYFYIITAKGKDGNFYNKKGTITLTR